MLSFLPAGFLGLVVASLFAAFMSTTASQINWGSSYIVNDFYQRFLNPQATEKQLVRVGRISTVVLITCSALLALLLSNALQAFNILLQIGAGTGLIFILRWFWWRINAYTELAGMLVSFAIAIYFEVIHPLTGLPELSVPFKLVFGVVFTTIVWLIVTLLTRPSDTETLRSFYLRVHPGGPGWKKVLADARAEGIELEKEVDAEWDVPTGILGMVMGCFAVYSALFATGNWIYGRYEWAIPLSIVCLIAVYGVMRIYFKIKTDADS